MASFLVPCSRCKALIRFMAPPDPEIPQFCGNCAEFAPEPVFTAEQQAEFDEAKQEMGDRLSFHELNVHALHEGRG